MDVSFLRFLFLPLLLFLLCNPVNANDKLDELVVLFCEELNSQDGNGYKDARSIAEEMLLLGEEKNSDSWKVRGLIRLAFIELKYGKWRNEFGKKLDLCNELLKDIPPNIAHAEFNMFRGQMLGVWQEDIPGGIEKLKTAIVLAKQLREDKVLAHSFSKAAALYGLTNDKKRMLEYSERAYIISQHVEDDSIKIEALTRLVQVLQELRQNERAYELAKILQSLAPDSGIARWVQFCNGEDAEFLELLEKNAAKYLDLPQGELTPFKAEFVATHNTFLARAYKRLGRLKEAEECCELAIEHYRISKNKQGREHAGRARRMIEIMMIEDAQPRLDVLVEKLDDAGQLSTANPEWCGLIAKAYSRLGKNQKSTKWLSRQIEILNSLDELEYRNIHIAARDYWEGEILARKQIELANQKQKESQFAYYLLTCVVIASLSLIALGYMWLCGTRTQKDKLAQLVDERTRSLIAANKKSNMANEAKSEFLARVNHEIRNPLTAILGYCELLQLSNPERNARQGLLASGLMASSRHLLELVDDVLVVSRIENNEIESNQQEFNIHETVKDIRQIIADLASEKSLGFECLVEGEWQGQLFGDETKLRQVVLNLLSNAIKFTDKGKVSALFQLKPITDNLVNLKVKVRDTGRGIPVGLQPIIFDKFARGTHQIDGTGLGLHICKKLVEHLGGTIELESTNHGTSFLVSIPFEFTRRHQQETVDVLHPQQENDQTRILVVDDQKSIRETICFQLQAIGFESRSSAQMHETLELIKDWSPHIVLLDLRMPEHDGFEIQSAIRTQNFDVLVVAMTGDATDHVAQKCTNSGFDGFLTKPFQMQSMKKLVQQILVSNNQD